MADRYVSPTQAADYLDVSVRSIRNMQADGREGIPARRSYCSLQVVRAGRRDGVGMMAAASERRVAELLAAAPPLSAEQRTKLAGDPHRLGSVTDRAGRHGYRRHADDRR